MSLSSARRRLSAAICVLLAAAACGKKGPPLAPFTDLPAAVTDLTASRVGADVVLRFTVPAANVDARRPADLVRVEVYGSDRRLLQPADYLERGRLVGAVAVRPVAAADATPPEAPAPGLDQGARAAIVADLDAPLSPRGVRERDLRVEPVGDPAAVPVPAVFPDGGGPLVPTRAARFPTRFYVAAGVNRRGRRGPPSAVVEVPVVPAPAAPVALDFTYTAEALTVSWRPPPRMRWPIQAPAPRAGALGSRSVASFITATGYNVYAVPPPDRNPAPPAAGPPAALPLPPLNAAPLAEARFTESRVEFGVPRCFAVRTRETLGTLVLESAASVPACVTPVDTFPPATPRNLTLVASEGAISLIWDPNGEGDLAGYLVLRGEAPGEKLQALTAAPVPETTYRDTQVESGVAYVYAVLAVDTAGNVGSQSNRVEERGR